MEKHNKLKLKPQAKVVCTLTEKGVVAFRKAFEFDIKTDQYGDKS